MAVTILPSGIEVRCASVPLTLEWYVVGVPSASLDLHVERASGADEAVRVRPLSPGRFLLPVPSEPVVVVARPTTEQGFPNGVFLELRLRTPGDAAEYVLAEADLSGTPGSRLLSIAPAGGLLVLTAQPETLAAPPPGDYLTTESDGRDTPRARALPPQAADLSSLSELARNTAYAARRQIEGSRLPTDRLRDVVVAVDRSASMLPAVRSGALASMLEVIVGLSTVIARSPVLPVWQLGATPRQVPRPLAPGGVAAFVAEEFSEQASLSGTSTTPLAAAIGSPPHPTSVFVVTDGIPADAEAFAATVGSGTAQVSWHLLALARSRSDAAVSAEPWLDELAALPRYGWASVADISPGDGEGWLADRLAGDRRLDLLVATLYDWPSTAPAGAPAGRY